MGPETWQQPGGIDRDSRFFWLVFTANLGYIIFAACQKLCSKTYPAARHHSDLFSLTVIVVHILCGATVVFGGCACWLAIHTHRPWNPTRAAYPLAIAAIAHSVSNFFLLRKIPGMRIVNVPLYIFSTVYNAHRARRLLVSSSSISSSGLELERELLLLWCAVSTYVWVRYFIFLFGSVAESKFFATGGSVTVHRIVYSLALPCAAGVCVGVPAALLGGVDDRWTLGLGASVAVLGPAMIGAHWASVRVGMWLRKWQGARWVVQFLIDTTNPKVEGL